MAEMNDSFDKSFRHRRVGLSRVFEEVECSKITMQSHSACIQYEYIHNDYSMTLTISHLIDRNIL